MKAYFLHIKVYFHEHIKIRFLKCSQALTDEQKAKLREHRVACVAETGVSDGINS